MAITNPTSKYGDRKGRDKQQSEYLNQGRLQPRDIDLEQAVLGALMLETDAYAVVCDMLTPETFYEPAHSLIFEAIRTLGAAQQPIDMLTVTEQLRLDGNLDKIGGPLYISELTSRVTSSANIEFHARILAQKFVARQLITFAGNLETQAFDESNDIDDVLQVAEARIFEISQRNVKKQVTQIDPVIA
ncbi:MAG: replicative DNA helicase, partial [Muribaculaceae bacterium]|nr:replicative DNA helicase [Muribaculaceae bacterium]